MCIVTAPYQSENLRARPRGRPGTFGICATSPQISLIFHSTRGVRNEMEGVVSTGDRRTASFSVD